MVVFLKKAVCHMFSMLTHRLLRFFVESDMSLWRLSDFTNEIDARF